jgi:hypothetical protein
LWRLRLTEDGGQLLGVKAAEHACHRETNLSFQVHGIAKVWLHRHWLEDGVQLLELCGGFGPVWTGKIIEAVDGKIPVGSVGYGPESIDLMHALFKD